MESAAGMALREKVLNVKPNAPIPLNYEPLQVLSEMLADPTYTDRRLEERGLIGGGPQVVKVYPFMRTMHYAVAWKVGEKLLSL